VDMEQPCELEVVVERDASAYGFTVRARANGRLHRIMPVRDPQQPRFWCVVIYRCSPSGIPDADGQVWIGPRGLERDALKETLATIRADPAAWLAEPVRHTLRAWMIDPTATAPPSPPRARSAHPTVSDAP
jgi:hypothetical protein